MPEAVIEFPSKELGKKNGRIWNSFHAENGIGNLRK